LKKKHHVPSKGTLIPSKGMPRPFEGTAIFLFKKQLYHIKLIYELQNIEAKILKLNWNISIPHNSKKDIVF
jgi:hypothetical protein